MTRRELMLEVFHRMIIFKDLTVIQRLLLILTMALIRLYYKTLRSGVTCLAKENQKITLVSQQNGYNCLPSRATDFTILVAIHVCDCIVHVYNCMCTCITSYSQHMCA